MRSIAHLSFAALVAAGVGILGGCFSEHVQAPSDGQCVASPDSTAQGSPIISIVNFSFQPVSTCVDAGTTVTWMNNEPPAAPAHTTTADQSAWGSALLNPGDTYAFTFTQTGTFAYHCTPHPFMQASVVVQ